MPGSPTPIYGLVNPTVGGDTNAWGPEVNGNWSLLDTLLGLPRIPRAAVPVSGVMDLSQANAWTLTVTAPVSPTFINVPAGTFCTRVSLRVINGGAFAITWLGSIVWATGAPPLLQTAGTDLVELLTFDNGATWYGIVNTGRRCYASVGASATQNGAGNPSTLSVKWNTKFKDTDAFFTNGSANLTVPVAGTYRFTFVVPFEVSGGSSPGTVQLAVGGLGPTVPFSIDGSSGIGAGTLVATGLITLAANGTLAATLSVSGASGLLVAQAGAHAIIELVGP